MINMIAGAAILTTFMIVSLVSASAVNASSAAWLFNRCNSVRQSNISTCEGFMTGIAHAIFYAEYNRPDSDKSWCMPKSKKVSEIRKEFIIFAKKYDRIMELPAGIAVALMYSNNYSCRAAEDVFFSERRSQPLGFVNVCVPSFILRNGPGILYGVISEIKLPKKTAVVVLDVNSNWLRVRVLGEIGWAHRSAFGIPWTEMGEGHPSPQLAIKIWPCLDTNK